MYEAYKAVKSNQGAAGVDGQTLEQFESDLKRNLYKIWNRMSSGSYFPPPVRPSPFQEEWGRADLGVPTVSDRIAQVVVKQQIEAEMEAIFLPDSYGYRPGKSALEAVGVTRERCWKHDWFLSSISRVYSITSITRCCSRLFGSTSRVAGRCFTSRDG